MGRKRDSRRDEALRMYVKSFGKISHKEISEFLKVPVERLRKWKCLDEWDRILALPPDERNLPKHKGPPFGSKNALGNKGGKGGPYGNKNAAGRRQPKIANATKTMEHTAISLDTLTDEERELYEQITADPIALVDERIRLLAIRERRMMLNLNKVKQEKALIESTEEHILMRSGDDPKNPSVKEVTKRRQALIDKIIMIEDAITRVQDKLLNAIEKKERMLREREAKEKEDQEVGGVTFEFKRD